MDEKLPIILNTSQKFYSRHEDNSPKKFRIIISDLKQNRYKNQKQKKLLIENEQDYNYNKEEISLPIIKNYNLINNNKRPNSICQSLKNSINQNQHHELNTNNNQSLKQRKTVKIENNMNDNNIKDQINNLLKSKFDQYKVLYELNESKSEGNTVTKLKQLSNQLEYDGWVNIRQFSTLIKACNLKIPKSELNILYNYLDKDAIGKISSDAFKKLIDIITKIDYPIQTQLFLKIFEMIDINNKGSISNKELTDFFKEIGFELSMHDTNSIFSSVGDRIDQCTFLSIFEFKPESQISQNQNYDSNSFQKEFDEAKESKQSKIQKMQRLMSTNTQDNVEQIKSIMLSLINNHDSNKNNI